MDYDARNKGNVEAFMVGECACLRQFMWLTINTHAMDSYLSKEDEPLKHILMN